MQRLSEKIKEYVQAKKTLQEVRAKAGHVSDNANFFVRIKRAIYKDKTPSECIVYTLVFALFVAIAFSYVYVLFWCLISGMRTHDAVALYPFEDIFKDLQFKKIFEAFEMIGEFSVTNFFGMLINSLYFSITSVVVNLFCVAGFAYVTTKYEFPGSKFVYSFALIIMILPIYGSSGAEYKLYTQLKLINNPLQAIVCSTSGLGMGYMYFNAFYRGLSNTYKEAAEIDGANDFAIYFRIVLPQAMGLIGALFLTNVIGGWNGYQGFLIYMPGLPNLSAGIYLFKQQLGSRPYMEYVFGACFIVSIPPLILFALFNKAITSNVSLGGIKE